MKDFMTPDMNLTLMNAAQNNADQKVRAFQKSIEQRKAENGSVDEAAQDFEAVFIAEMMKPMFADISTEAPFGGGKGEEVFRGMLLQEYGKIVAQTGSIGLSDHIKSEMIRMQAKIDTGHDLIEEHEAHDQKGMQSLETYFKNAKVTDHSTDNAEGAQSDAADSNRSQDQ